MSLAANSLPSLTPMTVVSSELRGKEAQLHEIIFTALARGRAEEVDRNCHKINLPIGMFGKLTSITVRLHKRPFTNSVIDRIEELGVTRAA